MPPESGAVHVAICIVSYKTPQDVGTCLAALSRSRHADFEVVICENGGPEAYVDIAPYAKPLPGGQPVTTLLAPGNLGYAGGVNACMAAAPDADAWWVLNPDTEAEAGALAALVARLERGDCDAVGGPVWLSDGRVQSYGGRWRRPLARAISIGHGQPPRPAPGAAEIEQVQNYLNGASMLIGRRFLETVGPMREDYFLYCEEVEWCLRGAALGMRLGFAPDGGVRHDQGSSTGNTVDLKARSRMSVHLNERNRILMTRDLFPSLLPVAALAALMILTLRYVRAGAWRQWIYALQGWTAGLANRRGPSLA